MRKLMVVALVAISLFGLQVQARSSRLVDPAPVAIPAGTDRAQVAADIRQVLEGRGWEIVSEAPGETRAILHLRVHTARIRATYDESQVQFAYVDSDNLDYEEVRGQRYIHRNYLGWMSFLAQDLKARFAAG